MAATTLFVLLVACSAGSLANKSLMSADLTSIGIKMLGMDKAAKQIQGAVNEFKDVGSFVSEQHKDFKKMVGSKYNSMTDRMDDRALEGFLARALPGVVQEDDGNNTCIEGFTAYKLREARLTLTKVRVVEPSALKILPAIKQDLQDRLQVLVSLRFGRLLLVADFLYNPDTISGRKREGVITLALSAPNRVDLNVTVDKSRKIVEALVADKKCFLTVQTLEVMIGEELTTEDVNYQSLLKGWTNGKGYTEQFVRMMIADMRPGIREDLRNALKRMVSKVITDPSAFCPSELTTPETMDCANVRDLGICCDRP